MTETIKLVLKHKWYDMIDRGEKTAEYRKITPYYAARLLKNGHKKADSVIFYRGYGANRKQMSFALSFISVGEGKQAWGAEPGEKYYILHLGRRLA